MNYITIINAQEQLKRDSENDEKMLLEKFPISLNKILSNSNIKLTKRFEFFVNFMDYFNVFRGKNKRFCGTYNLDCSSSVLKIIP